MRWNGEARGLGEGLTTHCENQCLLRNISRQNLGPGLIIWYDLSNERGTYGSSGSGMWGMNWIGLAQDTGGEQL
jgi:hypothetical protein